ncbi:hypothetical protein [Pseudonocardia broussonetiae]|uniref:Uncharacterized protein n=1 Tax=Pseudonocardia broussonetiae TaxID=2736640 RepID=A0A6M6JPX0_9PSEU|nr:hypothetical protein [Pseudonocardia broussonetiae]QJY49027.1 hypothetical protein HOP40_27300 [Pseudonocardia broussonetiae]
MPRLKQVVVRFSDAELAVVRERAASAGLAVGAWIGQTVLDTAEQGSGSVWALPDLLRLHADVVAVQRAGAVEDGRLDALLVRLEAVVEVAAAEFEARR